MNFQNQLPKRFGARRVTDLKAKGFEFSQLAVGQELKGSNYLRTGSPGGSKKEAGFQHKYKHEVLST